MPTLYDNFSQIRQYIDENAGQADLSSYVTKTELANASYATTSQLATYLPLGGGTLSGNLFAGDQEKTTVTFLATRRKCGGESGTSYMASFFTNSDGRSKFAHKSYTGTKADVSNDVDDAFMCFNAYGFKIAYSGEQGVAASTEYDVIHSGNIQSFIPVIDENIIPKETETYTLGVSGTIYKATYSLEYNIGSNSKMYNDGGGFTFIVNGNNGFRIGSNALYPRSNKGYSIGSSSNNLAYTYTQNLILNGTDINQPLSKGIWHIGTCTTYTNETTAYCTATVDNFELDSNNNPLVGTIIAIKVTSVNQSKNGAAMKLNVNGTGQKPLYCQTGERTSTSRSWYYDMNVVGRWYYWMWDGTYWVWINVGQEQDSTYSTMSDSEMSTGTATNSRTVTAKSLATYYVSKSFLSSCGYLTSVPSEYITETELSACGYFVNPPSSMNSTWNVVNSQNPYYTTAQTISPSFVYTYLASKEAVNAMFSYDTTTGTLTITTL